MVKAIGLMSGGLDSLLATKIVSDLKVDVIAINFRMAFSHFDGKRLSSKNIIVHDKGLSEAFLRSQGINAGFEIIDLGEDYLHEVLHNPQHGYGKNVNPCIDCHTFMLKAAQKKMIEYGAEFVFTGEVIGQRPMSQQLQQLTLIADRSGLKDRLLRPLSAGLLPETLPEREGMIDRSSLLKLSGRNRKPQIALAAEFGITDYETPAGGCMFTDPIYARKVRDMWKHKGRDKMTWEDYRLLRIGRHFRIQPDLKVIVGRNESENDLLEELKGSRTKLEVAEIPGPIVLIDEDPSSISSDMLNLAARLAARYSDGKDLNESLAVEVTDGGGMKIIEVQPFTPEEIVSWVIT